MATWRATNAFTRLRGHHVRTWLAIVAATAAVGMLGYLALGWSVGDAIYMTGITLTTVGFKEVRDLDDIGRLWTLIVAVAGVAIIFGSVGHRRRGGPVGRGQRARGGEADDPGDGWPPWAFHPVPATGGSARPSPGSSCTPASGSSWSTSTPDRWLAPSADGHLVVMGDATNDEILRAAGIDRARGLITTIDTDANNVYVTLSARALNSGLFIVARANQDGSEAKLAQAGADRIVSPYTRAGRQIAELAVRPRVADFIDFALSHGELAFSIEEVKVAQGGPLDGLTVGSLRDRGIFSLAVVRGERDYEPNPATDRVLRPGEALIVSGSAATLQELRAQA